MSPRENALWLILGALAFLGGLFAAAHADVMPPWVITGILAVETRSYLADGQVVYVDQRTGAAGELSAFQITKAAFDLVRHRGERFSRLRVDQAKAMDVARRILWHDYRVTGSWFDAVAGWIVHLAGAPGKALERRHGTASAARRIVYASDPSFDRPLYFYRIDNDFVMREIEECAERERAAQVTPAS